MGYQAGDAIAEEFITSSATGAATDADSLPTATLARNGTDDGTVTLTVAKIDTGRYKVTGTIPAGYAAGDKVAVAIAATIGGVAGKAVIPLGVLDTRVADYATQLGRLDATITSRLATASYTAPPSAADNAAAVWSAADRTLTAFGFSVTVGTNNDKSGYSLAAAPPTAAAIATQILDTEQTGGGSIREAIRAIAAAEAGNLTESADGTSTTIQDWADSATTRITSVNTNTTRTVTVAD